MLYNMALPKLFTMIVNIIIVSIPEELFVVVFTLILLKRFDLLRLNGANVLKISVPILPVAVITNIIKYYVQNEDIQFFLGAPLMFILIAVTYNRLRDFKGIAKTLISCILSLTIMLIFQASYVPLLLYTTGMEVEDMNSTVLINFLCTIPERVMEIALISYILTRKLSIFKVNVIKTVAESKKLLAAALSIALVNIVFLYLACTLIAYDKILTGVPLPAQLVIIVTVLMLPVLNIGALWVFVYNIKSREMYGKLLEKDRLTALADILRLHADNGSYEKINLVLDDLRNNINSDI